ncbi:amino acid ABC transporter permease [Acuticoccus kandeliae]|uniref:amino acid ABC transporter permease n=1 Tax=Acuticoccus kandeliae TaxID=2073160 RepID=UPI000D3E7F8A|nr:amino acid ABC transporter permease [Acuticoccus kandeliae]
MISNFNRFVLANIDTLLQGLWVTVSVCFLAFLLAIVLGLTACLIRLYVPVVRYLAIGYIEFCRATPIFVQLLWVNYVWPELFGFPRSVFTAGVIALALQSSGYLAETFRSGIEGLARGQIESGLAVGMRYRQVFAHIVMPQVLLVMAPSLINQIAVVIKSSTLVSVIAIPDLMYEAMRIVNQWFEPIEILTSVALMYFIVIFLISMLANYFVAHFNRKLGMRSA